MLSNRERQGDECGLLLVGEVEGNGEGRCLCVWMCVCLCVCGCESTHLIRIMFQRAVVAHVSHPVQICVFLVHIVHVRAVVLFIQYACRMNENVSNEIHYISIEYY